MYKTSYCIDRRTLHLVASNKLETVPTVASYHRAEIVATIRLCVYIALLSQTHTHAQSYNSTHCQKER